MNKQNNGVEEIVIEKYKDPFFDLLGAHNKVMAADIGSRVLQEKMFVDTVIDCPPLDCVLIQEAGKAINSTPPELRHKSYIPPHIEHSIRTREKEGESIVDHKKIYEQRTKGSVLIENWQKGDGRTSYDSSRNVAAWAVVQWSVADLKVGKIIEFLERRESDDIQNFQKSLTALTNSIKFSESTMNNHHSYGRGEFIQGEMLNGSNVLSFPSLASSSSSVFNIFDSRASVESAVQSTNKNVNKETSTQIIHNKWAGAPPSNASRGQSWQIMADMNRIPNAKYYASPAQGLNPWPAWMSTMVSALKIDLESKLTTTRGVIDRLRDVKSKHFIIRIRVLEEDAEGCIPANEPIRVLPSNPYLKILASKTNFTSLLQPVSVKPHGFRRTLLFSRVIKVPVPVFDLEGNNSGIVKFEVHTSVGAVSDNFSKSLDATLDLSEFQRIAATRYAKMLYESNVSHKGKKGKHPTNNNANAHAGPTSPPQSLSFLSSNPLDPNSASNLNSSRNPLSNLNPDNNNPGITKFDDSSNQLEGALLEVKCQVAHAMGVGRLRIPLRRPGAVLNLNSDSGDVDPYLELLVSCVPTTTNFIEPLCISVLIVAAHNIEGAPLARSNSSSSFFKLRVEHFDFSSKKEGQMASKSERSDNLIIAHQLSVKRSETAKVIVVISPKKVSQVISDDQYGSPFTFQRLYSSSKSHQLRIPLGMDDVQAGSQMRVLLDILDTNLLQDETGTDEKDNSPSVAVASLHKNSNIDKNVALNDNFMKTMNSSNSYKNNQTHVFGNSNMRQQHNTNSAGSIENSALFLNNHSHASPVLFNPGSLNIRSNGIHDIGVPIRQTILMQNEFVQNTHMNGNSGAASSTLDLSPVGTQDHRSSYIQSTLMNATVPSIGFNQHQDFFMNDNFVQKGILNGDGINSSILSNQVYKFDENVESAGHINGTPTKLSINPNGVLNASSFSMSNSNNLNSSGMFINTTANHSNKVLNIPISGNTSFNSSNMPQSSIPNFKIRPFQLEDTNEEELDLRLKAPRRSVRIRTLPSSIPASLMATLNSVVNQQQLQLHQQQLQSQGSSWVGSQNEDGRALLATSNYGVPSTVTISNTVGDGGGFSTFESFSHNSSRLQRNMTTNETQLEHDESCFGTKNDDNEISPRFYFSDIEGSEQKNPLNSLSAFESPQEELNIYSRSGPFSGRILKHPSISSHHNNINEDNKPHIAYYPTDHSSLPVHSFEPNQKSSFTINGDILSDSSYTNKKNINIPLQFPSNQIELDAQMMMSNEKLKSEYFTIPLTNQSTLKNNFIQPASEANPNINTLLPFSAINEGNMGGSTLPSQALPSTKPNSVSNITPASLTETLNYRSAPSHHQNTTNINNNVKNLNNPIVNNDKGLNNKNNNIINSEGVNINVDSGRISNSSMSPNNFGFEQAAQKNLINDLREPLGSLLCSCEIKLHREMFKPLELHGHRQVVLDLKTPDGVEVGSLQASAFLEAAAALSIDELEMHRKQLQIEGLSPSQIHHRLSTLETKARAKMMREHLQDGAEMVLKRSAWLNSRPLGWETSSFSLWTSNEHIANPTFEVPRYVAESHFKKPLEFMEEMEKRAFAREFLSLPQTGFIMPNVGRQLQFHPDVFTTLSQFDMKRSLRRKEDKENDPLLGDGVGGNLWFMPRGPFIKERHMEAGLKEEEAVQGIQKFYKEMTNVLDNIYNNSHDQNNSYSKANPQSNNNSAHKGDNHFVVPNHFNVGGGAHLTSNNVHSSSFFPTSQNLANVYTQ